MSYLITDVDGNRIPFQEGGILKKGVTLTADKTLTIEESGTTFRLDAIGEDITLPALLDGLFYKFICETTTVTSDWTVTAATAVIQGSVTVAGVVIPASDESLITLVVAKFLPGDWFTLECDGTNWYVAGQVVTVVGITFTAP